MVKTMNVRNKKCKKGTRRVKKTGECMPYTKTYKKNVSKNNNKYLGESVIIKILGNNDIEPDHPRFDEFVNKLKKITVNKKSTNEWFNYDNNRDYKSNLEDWVESKVQLYNKYQDEF